MKKTRKVVSTLVAVSLVGGLVLPVAGPAFAYSKNSVDKVLSIANNDKPHMVGTITIKEDEDYDNHFTSGDMFTMTLPSGVKWAKEDADGNPIDWENLAAGATIKRVSDTKLEVTIKEDNKQGSTDIDVISFAPYIQVKRSFEGDVKVNIDGRESAISSQELLIARALDGDTVTYVEEVETIGEVGHGGQITIEEAAFGSLEGTTKIKLKLPADFDWVISETYATKVEFSGSFDISGYTIDADDVDGRTLTISFDANERKTGNTQRGIIRITPGIKAANDADYGDIEVNVSGDVDDADVVVAKYADFNVTASVDEVKEIVSGRFDEETEEITIEEDVAGTLIKGRKLTLTLPTWVKVTGVNKLDGNDFGITSSNIDIDDNEVTMTIGDVPGGSSTGEIKFKLQLSVEAGKSGDIEMVIGGKSGAEGSLVIAKAVAPVKVETSKAQLKIGVKGQPLNDIIITENVAGAIQEEALGQVKDSSSATDARLKVELPKNIEWNDYTVEVIEGNLEIDEDAIDTEGDDDNVLVIPIKSESSKPSKIKISGITVDIDRTVPEGDVEVKVKGTAVAENVKGAYGWFEDETDAKGDTIRLDMGEFDSSTAAKAVAGVIVTPAPEAGTAVFSIGSNIYTAGGVTKVMDAAPYIKDGRTYVPVRYLALALGVAESDIEFENGVVTLTKGTDVVKLTIGSTSLLKNDETITMDVAPEVVDGRTMLPARFVAEAFGALVGYANGQVVISY